MLRLTSRRASHIDDVEARSRSSRPARRSAASTSRHRDGSNSSTFSARPRVTLWTNHRTKTDSVIPATLVPRSSAYFRPLLVDDIRPNLTRGCQAEDAIGLLAHCRVLAHLEDDRKERDTDETTNILPPRRPTQLRPLLC